MDRKTLPIIKLLAALIACSAVFSCKSNSPKNIPETQCDTVANIAVTDTAEPEPVYRVVWKTQVPKWDKFVICKADNTPLFIDADRKDTADSRLDKNEVSVALEQLGKMTKILLFDGYSNFILWVENKYVEPIEPEPFAFNKDIYEDEE